MSRRSSTVERCGVLFMAGAPWEWCPLSAEFVIPGLVPGIQLSANAGARGAMDPGGKHRDDTSTGASAIALQPHLLAPVLVHGADSGLGDQRVGGAGLGRRIELHQVLAVGYPLHPVLHELDRLVVLKPQEAGRPHQVTLAQAV